MNKQTIFLVVLGVAILVIALVLWNNNKKWATQTAINDLLKKQFPDLPIADADVIETKIKDSGETAEQIAQTSEETQAIETNAENNQQTSPSNNGKASPDAVRSFAEAIADMNELTNPSDIQFFLDNKQEVEEQLKLIRQERENPPVVKGKAGRHKNDCECEKCLAKKKSKNNHADTIPVIGENGTAHEEKNAQQKEEEPPFAKALDGKEEEKSELTVVEVDTINENTNNNNQ